MPGTNGDEHNPQTDESDIPHTGQQDTGNGEGQGTDEDKMGGGKPSS
ncbi:hypothetical protein ACFU99_02670 [Streptomyces sp. NPDC057654]